MDVDERIDEGLRHARRLGEVGVQVAAYLDGELIVDAWTGTADPAGSGRLVDGDTLFTAFSVTKGVTSTALAVLAERGLVDYDAPVTDYWPEYGRTARSARRSATPPPIARASRACPTASRPSRRATGTSWSARWRPRCRCSSRGRRTPTTR